ncbi:hypothetical protein CASFOL_018440 [Castilleja foliolosa]|uniref:Uncharacterized protein n=1 Tax=Castilleja foliolosa TaxID=1961234 RepID=A0ABD3D7N6_9LAMI
MMADNSTKLSDPEIKPEMDEKLEAEVENPSRVKENAASGGGWGGWGFSPKRKKPLPLDRRPRLNHSQAFAEVSKFNLFQLFSGRPRPSPTTNGEFVIVRDRTKEKEKKAATVGAG